MSKPKNITLITVVSVLCVLIFIAIFTIRAYFSSGSPELTINSDSNGYQAAVLMQYKNKYVGNAVNVGNLLRSLPYAEYLKGGISLQTENTPYGINVNYNFSQKNAVGDTANRNTVSNTKIDLNQIEIALRNHAIVIFALIDNVDVVNITADLGAKNLKPRYTRAELQQSFPRDIRDYARNKDELQILLNSFNLKILAYPQAYTQSMSNTPGIRMAAQFDGAGSHVQYSAEKGIFEYYSYDGRVLTKENINGKTAGRGSKAEYPLGTAVYWSPTDMDNQFSTNSQSEIPIMITVMQNGIKIAEKQAIIHYDGSTAYFTFNYSDDVIITDSHSQDTIDGAVSRAVKNQGKGYLTGEVATEGHIILDREAKDGEIKVYTIASFGYFGFENGIFTNVSGSGAIPTVMTFSRNESGEYVLLRYEEPQDGAYYLDSVKKMFPQKLWPEVLPEGKHYLELNKQKEEQAVAYLKSIGLDAKVNAGYVEKKLVEINVEASNKLFAELTKHNSLLNSCPYWIGSRETIENGVRYIYETSQSKTGDGYDLVIFQKKKADGSIIMESKYKIVEKEPQLIE